MFDLSGPCGIDFADASQGPQPGALYDAYCQPHQQPRSQPHLVFWQVYGECTWPVWQQRRPLQQCDRSQGQGSMHAKHATVSCSCAGSAMLLMHQRALSQGLINWVHSNVRSASLISQNKEGLGSLLGYWALHMLSVAVAKAIRHAMAGNQSDALPAQQMKFTARPSGSQQGPTGSQRQSQEATRCAAHV